MFIKLIIYFLIFFNLAMAGGLQDIPAPVTRDTNPGHGSESRVLTTGPPGNPQLYCCLCEGLRYFMLILIPECDPSGAPRLMPGQVFRLPSPWWPWTSILVPQIFDFLHWGWASLPLSTVSLGLQKPLWDKQHQMLGSLLWAFLHSGILTSVADLLEEMTLVLHLQLFVYLFGSSGI